MFPMSRQNTSSYRDAGTDFSRVLIPESNISIAVCPKITENIDPQNAPALSQGNLADTILDRSYTEFMERNTVEAVYLGGGSNIFFIFWTNGNYNNTF